MKERVISKQEYDDFRDYLVKETGIVLGENKHYLVSSRLNRLMEEHNLDSYAQLLKLVSTGANKSVCTQIVDAMTTNETMWFRDTYPYEILKSELLPTLNKIKDRPVKIWSAACSSGQEPYSISMIIHEFMASNPGAFSRGIQIVATDISTNMLKYCQRARYDDSAMRRGMSEDRKKQFFTQFGDEWEVNREIRSRITFKSLNLQQSYSALGKFDMIFCRNVLIYFDSETKSDILNRMSNQIEDDGFLFLGGAETVIGITDSFASIPGQRGLYAKHDSKHLKTEAA